MAPIHDRKAQIIDAGVAVLREEGFAAFTQPRVAQRAGIRQSHLTYYFATRQELLVAVARHAVEVRLAELDAVLHKPPATLAAAARAIARVVAYEENNRVLLALAAGADVDREVQRIFGELADGVAQRATRLLVQFGITPSAAAVDLLHALSVGLAVLNLSLGSRRDPRLPEQLLTLALSALEALSAAQSSSKSKRRTAHG
jgi:AcrR family transcriptional regulator